VGGSRKGVPFLAKINKEDLAVLQELLEAGNVTPVIDRQYSLSEVPAALSYLGEGHSRGKVVITV
jgi:NADPH:quinone reductase-like Zn-dependent oxidoreductase